MLAGFTWFETEKRAGRTLAFERENGFINVVVVHAGVSLSKLMSALTYQMRSLLQVVAYAKGMEYCSHKLLRWCFVNA